MIEINAEQAKTIGLLASVSRGSVYVEAVPEETGVLLIRGERPDEGWVLGPNGQTGYFSQTARKMLGLPELRWTGSGWERA